jgi:hypothetical protein
MRSDWLHIELGAPTSKLTAPNSHGSGAHGCTDDSMRDKPAASA